MNYKDKTQSRKRFLVLCEQSIELGLEPSFWRQAKAEMEAFMSKEAEKNAKLKQLDFFLWQLVENGEN